MVEKPSLEQSYDQDLKAERVAIMANLVAQEMHTQTIGKKHGSYLIYDDEKLVISLDTYTPTINISIIREEQPINVFSAGHRSWDRPGVFHPGEMDRPPGETQREGPDHRPGEEGNRAETVPNGTKGPVYPSGRLRPLPRGEERKLNRKDQTTIRLFWNNSRGNPPAV